LRAKPLVDHEGVAAAKFEILELLFNDFKLRPNDSFNAFVQQGGETLRNHAIFETLQEQAATPPAPTSPEVARFAELHADRILFHQYLQWLAHTQLQAAADTCRAHGMAVGLYLDLAVSVDGGGSDAWAASEVFAVGARVGAPADAFNPNGQDWGLLPMRPDRMRADRYRYFIETLRANMRHAGALRIDHVMGLMRLFWIPKEHTARSGAYVHYAMDEVLAIVVLESQRNQCMVIGEDLGTVAPEMQQAMAERDLLSYRLLVLRTQQRQLQCARRLSAERTRRGEHT
jgi:(1->4)-alpha-D-glucan 1-alpha-D-glucosylmutase